jgi:hypothetical protein
VISATLDNATQGELQRYENNYKALNLITTALGRILYDRVSHLETTHNIWLKLCNTYKRYSEIKSTRRDTYNRQYQTFSQMIALLILSPLSIAYVLVVNLLILTMNVLNNFSMHLMILYGA